MLSSVKRRGGKSSRDESGREAEESGVDERQREKRELSKDSLSTSACEIAVH